jgi:hypothetical protein
MKKIIEFLIIILLSFAILYKNGFIVAVAFFAVQLLSVNLAYLIHSIKT